jgi:OmpA-OmpF porin, OOP family
MEAIRIVRRSPAGCMLGLSLLLSGAAHAQLVHRGADPWEPRPAAFAAGQGLQPARAEYQIGCGASLLRCEPGQTPSMAAAVSPLNWNLELSQLNLGRADRFSVGPMRQGLNLSLVGRRPISGSSFSVYGKLGATYGYTDPAGAPAALAAGGPEHGYGVSFGAGLSMDLTPRLSATLGFDSHDLRLGGGRDGFRSTSLGLQYRY